MSTVQRVVDYVLLLALSTCVVCLLLPISQWPGGCEGPRYLFLMEHVRAAMADGVGFPSWLPRAYGGYGYPVFVFYPPGFFVLCTPAMFLLDDIPQAIFVSLIALVFLGGAGACELCRYITQRRFALAGGVFFLLTPYVYVNLCVRGDLSELTAMMIVPWTWLSLITLLRHTQANRNAGWSVVGLGVSGGALIYAHPATAAINLVAIFLAGIMIAAQSERCARGVVRGVLSAVLALSLSVYYWLPAMQMSRFVAYESAISWPYLPSQHLVSPRQMLSREWGFTFSPVKIGGEMSLQLGLPHFLLAVVGATIAWRCRARRVVSVVYIALLFMMSPLSARLWDGAFVLRFIQFPWRILSVTATLQVICFSGISNVLPSNRRDRRVITVAMALLIAGWYIEQFGPCPVRWEATRDSLAQHRVACLSEFNTYAAANEFTPRSAVSLDRFGPRRDRGLLENANGARDLGNEHAIRFAFAEPRYADVVINQLWFPGWRVVVNGRLLNVTEFEAARTVDGRIHVRAPTEGVRTIEAGYDAPPGSRKRLVVVLAGVLITVVGLLADFRFPPR